VLFDTAGFEPLTDEPWDDERVRAAIRAIVADAEAAFDAVGLWPANEWDAWQAPTPLKGLYGGAGGVVWALDALQRREHAQTSLELPAAATRAFELGLTEPDYMQWDDLPSKPASSLLVGEAGLLLVNWRLTPRGDVADRLLERVRENCDNEFEELMWGSPGTMLAARVMHEWTGEERWLEAWRESAEALMARRDADGLWTQQLYGNAQRLLGPAHGLVGIVHALLQVESEWSESLGRETAEILAREAIVEDGLATWPATAGGPLAPASGSGIRLQWCHGAPGMVATAAPYLDEELLLAGAELTWRAGAHREEKGAGLCHGTSGNGYALLKTFERTGDERWLERARAFAMHAAAQVEAARTADGRGRYALWTGDIGAAVLLERCLDGTERGFPTLDAW
jgi:Lanthionine synthetase C-like protein